MEGEVEGRKGQSISWTQLTKARQLVICCLMAWLQGPQCVCNELPGAVCVIGGRLAGSHFYHNLELCICIGCQYGLASEGVTWRGCCFTPAGHLSCLAATDLYRYLSQEHDATIIGVLLGMAAAKRYTRSWHLGAGMAAGRVRDKFTALWCCVASPGRCRLRALSVSCSSPHPTCEKRLRGVQR